MATIKSLAETLFAEREKKRLSPTEFASQAGVSRAGLYRFADGGDIRLSTLLAMADTLGLDIVLVPKVISSSLHTRTYSTGEFVKKQSMPRTPGVVSAVEARKARVMARLATRNTKL